MDVLPPETRRRPLLVDSKFRLGDRVYHRACPDKDPGILTEIHVYSSGLTYSVAWGDRSQTSHYSFELSLEWEPILESDDD